MKRRDFLKIAGMAAAGGVAGAGGAWPRVLGADTGGPHLRTDDGVAHILPTVSHDRMLLKVSFYEPQPSAPELRVNSGSVVGQRTDSEGRFWQFDVTGLSAATSYQLSLARDGCEIFPPWNLATFPAPDATPSSFRLLAFTCAGGHDIFGVYVPLPLRQRMLRRALELAPDAVLAIGDHVYWDLRSLPGSVFLGNSSTARDLAGPFDRDAPVLGTANERVLRGAVDYQIAQLYGTLLRETPVFFARDDHDYFEDDRATDALTTFPPDPFMFDLARSTQHLYFPEFLPDTDRPLSLPDSGSPDRPVGVSETFGTIRYGRLVEALVYDCKGYVTLAGQQGVFVPPSVESWVVGRFGASPAAHVVNVPSNPLGWSAGKFVEWYPDVIDDGQLTTSIVKNGWQEGWLAQHDRILDAQFQRGGVALAVSGDMHSIAEGRITRSGSLDFSSNPIISLIAGTPATGPVGWPSVVRGLEATPPGSIDLVPEVAVEEINGFHLIDFEPGRVTIRHFRWDLGVDAPAAIDTLEPFHTSVHTVT